MGEYEEEYEKMGEEFLSIWCVTYQSWGKYIEVINDMSQSKYSKNGFQKLRFILKY